MNTQYWIYFYLLISLVITKVPYIGKYFSVANTMIHENFHILFSFLTNGKGISISLFSDTSGLAKTKYKYRLGKVLTSYAGYTGSSFAAIVLFYSLSQGYYNEIIYFFIGLSIYNLIFWVRNLYGIVWLISFIGITFSFAWNQYDIVMTHMAIFLSSIVLIDQFTSALIVFKASLLDKKNAGDCTSLAEATYIPSFMWGIIFLSQSTLALYYTFINFIN